MTHTKQLRTASSALALLASTVFCSNVVLAQQVGTASAVNPAATVNLRTISIGASIAHKERIQTKAGGSVQLLFLDKTSMTIGPNSDLTIDEYVYDPKANTGKLAATLGKGALRFVGGQISHSGEAEVKTASAVIGIRGGVMMTDGKGGVYAGYGSSTVTTSAGSVTLAAGEFTQVSGSTAAPTQPGLPPSGFVAAQVQAFQSSGGQTGGAGSGAASPARVATAEARATGSPNATVAAVAVVSASGEVQVSTATRSTSTVTTTTQQNAIATTVQQSAQTSTQAVAAVQTAQRIEQGPTPPVVVPPPVIVVPPPVVVVPPPILPARAFALSVTPCCDPANATSSVPYLPANFATGNGSRYISSLVGYRGPGAIDDVNVRSRFIQYGINIAGLGAAQSSWGFLASGSLAADGSGGFVEPGGVVATRRGSALSSVGVINSAASSTPSSVVIGSDGAPVSATTNSNYLIPETNKYSTSSSSFLNLGDGSGAATYTFTQNQSQTTAPSGLGAVRPAAVLTGWAGGLMRTFNTTAGQFVAPTFSVGGAAMINLDSSSNTATAAIAVANTTASASDTFSYGSYVFGIDQGVRTKGAYVDYDNFGARGAQSVSDLTTGAEVPLSSVNGQGLNSHLGFFFNVTRAVAQQIAPALSSVALNFCQCDVTRWGFWSGTDNRTDANGNNVSDVGNLMTWVAGTPAVTIPTTGTATYGGHVIANVQNGNNAYIAAGNLINTVNFGARTGTSTVSGFDGGYYSGTLTIAPGTGTNILAASLTSQSRTMNLVGQFYQGANDPAGEMGGQVSISGPNYLGSGIFAASTAGVVNTTQYAPIAFVMDMTKCCDVNNPTSAAPYLPAGFFGTTTGSTVTSISKVLGYRVGSQDNPAAAVTLQSGLSISGQGAAQSSSFFVATGSFSNDGSGNLVNSSGFFASRRGAANSSMGRADGTFSSPAGSVTVDANKLPLTARITNDYYVNESKTYVANPGFSFAGGGAPTQNYTFTQSASQTYSQTAAQAATLTATDATTRAEVNVGGAMGVNRPEVVLRGFTGGLMRTINTDTSTFVAPSFATSGTATVTLNPNTSRVQANFNVSNVTPGAGDTFSTGNFQLGSTTASRSESAYIDYDNFGARRQVSVTDTQTGATAPISTVNNQALTGHNAAMINASPAEAQKFANAVGTNVTFCQCDYTRWGFWSNDSDRTSNGANVADRGNLMTWVAGRATTAAEVPTTGTATYDGHVVASIKAGTNEYVAAGNLTNVVNFGTRSGAVTVTNLDNRNYTGTVAISSSDPRNFGGTLSGTGAATMNMGGQFFRGVASPVGEMGGGVTISGASYIGSGIFAAKAR